MCLVIGNETYRSHDSIAFDLSGHFHVTIFVYTPLEGQYSIVNLISIQY